MEQNILNNYNQNISHAQKEANKFKALANKYSLLRLAIFATIIIMTGIAIEMDDFTFFMIVFVIMVVAFLLLVSKQSEFEKQKHYFNNLVKVYQNELDSMLSYANLYDDGAQFNNDKHFYSADLDIFGNASLYKLTNRAATSLGKQKLAIWFDAPSQKETILLRQTAISEIASKDAWKPETQALLLFANQEKQDQLPNLFKYLKIPLDLPNEKVLNLYAKIAPYLLGVLIIGGYYVPIVSSFSVLVGLINMGIVFSKAMYIKRADLIAGKIGDVLNNYALVFQKIENESWESAYNKTFSDFLKNDGTSNKIKSLSILINKLNYHLNIIIGFILNLFFLWDIRQIIAIENWKRYNQKSLETAFDVIAEFEALMSLASLKINYPDWATPEIVENNDYTLIANGMAHPLISSTKRVNNDFELNNTRKIDIITGSNMAGKSTFLRTVGINTVLALCGAPVCAEEMKVSVITIISYMRIKDNLNESTSTFKAELDRLQMLLNEVATNKKVFFLIDEMLRGTNSVDKYLGSKAVIKNLITKNGVGMVATHDLQIADLENSYPNYIRNFYFDIQVIEGEMLFDYKIKPGACKTFNATLLLKQIGIEVE